jgi:hypothetical protein
MFIRLSYRPDDPENSVVINIGHIQRIERFLVSNGPPSCVLFLTDGREVMVQHPFDDVVALIEQVTGDIPSLPKANIKTATGPAPGFHLPAKARVQD